MLILDTGGNAAPHISTDFSRICTTSYNFLPAYTTKAMMPLDQAPNNKDDNFGTINARRAQLRCRHLRRWRWPTRSVKLRSFVPVPGALKAPSPPQHSHDVG